MPKINMKKKIDNNLSRIISESDPDNVVSDEGSKTFFNQLRECCSDN